MPRYMTKAQAVAEFKSEILPWVKDRYEQDGIPDWPARSEAWATYTDGLCRDGLISERQDYTWVAPPFVDRRK